VKLNFKKLLKSVGKWLLGQAKDEIVESVVKKAKREK
jgi:hypothetical protein